MPNTLRTIALLLLLCCQSSFAQLPFTIENMENFSSMNQHDFIAAMKAFPGFKEEVAHRTGYTCEFDQSDSAGHGVFSHFILVYDEDKKDGKITVTMSSLFISRYVDTFALSLKNRGYKETTDSSDQSIGFRAFNKRPYDFYLPTPQKGHKGILVMNNVPPAPHKRTELSGDIINSMDIEIIQDALSDGAGVNDYLYTPSNYHPLEFAIEMDEVKYFDSPQTIQKHLDLIKFLLDNGADVNKKDNWGKTPLILACDHHVWLDTVAAGGPFYDKVVDLLLAKGANPNITNDYGEAPIVNAVSNQRIEQVKSLLAHGADKNSAVPKGKGYGGYSALDIAKGELKHAKGTKKETAQAILNLLQK